MTTSIDPAPSRWNRWLWIGLAQVVFGVVAIGVAVFLSWPFFSGLLTNPAHAVPGEFEQELEAGEYLVSFETSRNSGSGPVTFTRSDGIEVLELVVRAPDGTVVPLDDGRNQTVTRNNVGYSGFVTFEAETAGSYRFRVVTDEETTVLVTRSLFDFPLPAIVIGGVGLLDLVVGVVMAIVAVTRRSNERRTGPAEVAAPTAPPPPSIIS